MRVTHVIPQLTLGGAERVLLDLAAEQQRRGTEVRLIVLGSENAFPSRLADLPEPVFLGYGGSRRDWRGAIRCISCLRKWIKHHHPDVVHSHLWPASRAVGWAVRGLGLPHLVHVHDTRPWLAGGDLRSRLLRFWTRLSLRGTEAHGGFVAVSEAARTYTYTCLPRLADRIQVCHNGIRAEAFVRGRDAGEATGRTGRAGLVVGTAGRFAPEKGQTHLIRAVAALRERGLDVQLRIAGDGQLRPVYERLIASLGLSDVVELRGKVQNMQAFYRDLDIFVLPSVGAEGLPITLLEAMASGLPIIASDVAGVREAIQTGVEGMVVVPGDEAALVAEIAALSADRGRRERMAESALIRVTGAFSLEAMATRCGELYEQLITRGRGRTALEPCRSHG